MDILIHETEPLGLRELLDQMRLFFQCEEVVVVSRSDFEDLTVRASTTGPVDVPYVELDV